MTCTLLSPEMLGESDPYRLAEALLTLEKVAPLPWEKQIDWKIISDRLAPTLLEKG